jgi:hypothetical protein
MKSISVQYQELKEGKINRHQFLHNARMLFPNFVTNHNSFEDSVKILKNKGLLNEGDAVKGTPDKAPSYDYPTQPGKYKKVVQEPEVDEQDGIYPATTVTDIPKEEVSKPIKSKNRPDGLEPIKDKDKKNEMKKIRIVKESAEQEIAMALFAPNLKEDKDTKELKVKGKIVKNYKQNGDKSYSVEFEDGSKRTIAVSNDDWDTINNHDKNLKEDNKDKKDKPGLSTSPGTSVPMGAKTQSKIDSFLSQFRSPGASGPGQSLNTLKAKIKEIVREVLDEIGPGGIEAAGDPEEEASIRGSLIKKEYEMGDEDDKAPNIMSAANSVVDMMKTRIETNDIDLKWKESDVIDTFFDFQDRIGHRYSDEEYDTIIDSAMDKLKAQGYKMEL